MKMQGYNGSQLWDTTFAVQAICATGLAPEFSDCMRRAHHYVDVSQASMHDHPSYKPGTTVPHSMSVTSLAQEVLSSGGPAR